MGDVGHHSNWQHVYSINYLPHCCWHLLSLTVSVIASPHAVVPGWESIQRICFSNKNTAASPLMDIRYVSWWIAAAIWDSAWSDSLSPVWGTDQKKRVSLCRTVNLPSNLACILQLSGIADLMPPSSSYFQWFLILQQWWQTAWRCPLVKLLWCFCVTDHTGVIRSSLHLEAIWLKWFPATLL